MHDTVLPTTARVSVLVQHGSTCYLGLGDVCIALYDCHHQPPLIGEALDEDSCIGALVSFETSPEGRPFVRIHRPTEPTGERRYDYRTRGVVGDLARAYALASANGGAR